MKMNVYIILLIASGCYASNSGNWESFKIKHKKSYGTLEEDRFRKGLFESALQKVEENNRQHQNGTTTALLKVNKFADLTDDEFTSRQKLRPPRHIMAAAAANKLKTTKQTEVKLKSTKTIKAKKLKATKTTKAKKLKATKTTKVKKIKATKTTKTKKPTTTKPTPTKKTTTTKTMPTKKATTTKTTPTKQTTTAKTTPTKKTTTTKTTPIKKTTSNKHPTSIDWRTLGAVTPVKDQGSCGSCWTFSSTGALEGQWFRKTGKLVGLSQQQLLDCASAVEPHLYSCNGGNMDEAFDYVEKNKGIDTEASYPYVAKAGTCRFSNASIGATCRGYVILPTDENAILDAVATIGPISVGIGVTKRAGLYSSGLFTTKMCTSPINHAVLIVGYGTDSGGKKYWIVKNSWGASWGMDGYFYLPFGVNFCDVNVYATYPLV